jgi:hypothetical protein
MPLTPAILPLTPVEPERLGRIPGIVRSRQIKTDYPKRSISSKVESKAALARWHAERTPPKPPRNDDIKIKAQPLQRAEVTKLRSVAEAGLDPTVLEKQSVDLPEVFGTLFSSLATYRYMEMQAEYKRRKASDRGGAAADKRWQEILDSFKTLFASAGLRDVDEATLNEYVKELNANRANRDYVVEVANSAVETSAVRSLASLLPVAVIIPQVGVISELIPIVTVIKDLCAVPFAQGTYTKHFFHSVALTVKIPYPCCSWTSGCHWCYSTVTIASASVSLDLNVGYKVTCCGATAWGQGGVQVCGSILGVSVCAACSATIVGVAGVSRTPVATGCEYGLGVEAELKCSLAGHTILDLTYSFGWVVSGPCPPAGLCG